MNTILMYFFSFLLLHNYSHCSNRRKASEGSELPMSYSSIKSTSIPTSMQALVHTSSLSNLQKTNKPRRKSTWPLPKNISIDIHDEQPINHPLALRKKTPLEESIRSNNVSLTEHLLKNKADVNLPNYEGFFPLMIACKRRNADIVRLLLNADASVNVKGGSFKKTALLMATQNDASNEKSVDLEIVKMLILAGADPKIKDIVNESPLTISSPYIQDVMLIAVSITNHLGKQDWLMSELIEHDSLVTYLPAHLRELISTYLDYGTRHHNMQKAIIEELTRRRKKRIAAQ